MNILYFIFIFNFVSIFFPIFGNKYKYEECPINNPTCGNVENLLEYVTKCIGLVICYQSLLTNPDVFDNLKFHHEYEIPPGNGPRLCSKCIEMGQCKGSINGKKLEWNGVKIYFYESTQTLEIETDLIGNRFIQNITDTTPLKFLQLISKGNQQLLTLKNDKESNSALNGLNLDLFVWLERYDPLKSEGRKVYLGLHDTEECEEEMNDKSFVQLQPNCSYYANGPSHFDQYSCHCGSTSDEAKGINECCFNHYLCTEKINEECPSIPSLRYYKEINTSKYELDKSKFENEKIILCKDQPSCNLELCKCDSELVKCWESKIVPSSGKICESCYRDDGRLLAKKPISALMLIRKRFSQHEAKLLQITDKVVTNKLEIDSKIINVTILDATVEVTSGYGLIANTEALMFRIIETVQDQISGDINKYNISVANNKMEEARKFINSANYKHTVNELSSLEYFKEKFATYEAGEYVIQKFLRLAEIIKEKSTKKEGKEDD